MKAKVITLLLGLIFSGAANAGETKVIRLYPGYTTRINCRGRLILSAIGNEEIVQLDALPSELGCGIILKPKATKGRTDLAAETSAASILRIVNIQSAVSQPEPGDLVYSISGDSK